MPRNTTVKYPYSANLFHFVRELLTYRRSKEAMAAAKPGSRAAKADTKVSTKKVSSKNVGEILGLNAADCSYWKRGVKNVKSLIDLQSLAEALHIEESLVFDIICGSLNVNEAFFEYLEGHQAAEVEEKCKTTVSPRTFNSSNRKISAFVADIHEEADFREPPLYLPEAVRFFSFVSLQEGELVDELSQVMREKDRYVIRYQEGKLGAQTRWSVCKSLARIILSSERARYPELGRYSARTFEYECLLFCAQMLCPKDLLLKEMPYLKSRQDLAVELAKVFWAPKPLISFQLKSILNSYDYEHDTVSYIPTSAVSSVVAASKA